MADKVTRDSGVRGIRKSRNAYKKDSYNRQSTFVRSAIYKIVIRNLDYKVRSKDVTELFSEVGGLIKAFVNYDRSGRSLETADVIFERRPDALRAIREYDGIHLLGRRMRIKLVTNFNDSSTLRTQHRTQWNGNASSANGRVARISHKKFLTAEELDAELEGYFKDGEEKSSNGNGQEAHGLHKKSLTQGELDAELDKYLHEEEKEGNAYGQEAHALRKKSITPEELDAEMEEYFHEIDDLISLTPEELDAELDKYVE